MFRAVSREMSRWIAVSVCLMVAVQASAQWARSYEHAKHSRKGAVAPLPDGGAVVSSDGSTNALFTTDPDGNVVAARELSYQAWFVVAGQNGAVFAEGSSLATCPSFGS